MAVKGISVKDLAEMFGGMTEDAAKAITDRKKNIDKAVSGSKKKKKKAKKKKFKKNK